MARTLDLARTYFRFVGVRLQQYSEYRFDTAVLILASLLTDGVGLAFLWTVYQQVPTIQGWTAPELVVMYGFVVLAEGLCQMFFEGLWHFAYAVRLGMLDTFLVRPLPVLMSIVTLWMSPEGIGRVVLGGVLITSGLLNLSIAWTFWHVVATVLVVIAGIAIRMALTVIVNCLGFWIVAPVQFGDLSEPFYELSRYPLGIYSRGLKIFIITALPVAFVGSVPGEFVTRGNALSGLALISPVVAIALWIIALSMFRKGIRDYSGAGN